MPIAVPITEALEGKPLETVVAALAQIADTLARLQAEHGVAHRDLKPSNLYELEGEWLVYTSRSGRMSGSAGPVFRNDP
jgi:hypothetical protein